MEVEPSRLLNERIERHAQRVNLMQCRFDAAGNDLHRASDRRGGRNTKDNLLGLNAAFRRDHRTISSLGIVSVSKTPTTTLLSSSIFSSSSTFSLPRLMRMGPDPIAKKVSV